MNPPLAAKNLWIVPVIVGIAGFAIVHPFDGHLAEAATRLVDPSSPGFHLSGDVRRELFAWQQYGQGFAIAVTVIIVWLLDPTRRRRLLDLGLALAIAQVVSTGGKMLIGRPRPRPYFNDPHTFLSPWGEYPIVIEGKARLVHAWDTHAGAGTDLWSMPSSHTLFATVLSVFLAALYPRIRWLMVALTLLVACGRVMFDAHWPTDVVVGAAAGWLIGRVVVRAYIGIRAVDWVWTRLIRRGDIPALPRVLAEEAARIARRST